MPVATEKEHLAEMLSERLQVYVGRSLADKIEALAEASRRPVSEYLRLVLIQLVLCGEVRADLSPGDLDAPP